MSRYDMVEIKHHPKLKEDFYTTWDKQPIFIAKGESLMLPREEADYVAKKMIDKLVQIVGGVKKLRDQKLRGQFLTEIVGKVQEAKAIPQTEEAYSKERVPTSISDVLENRENGVEPSTEEFAEIQGVDEDSHTGDTAPTEQSMSKEDAKEEAHNKLKKMSKAKILQQYVDFVTDESLTKEQLIEEILAEAFN